jgi:O-antigen/teichoic acid export membrane protein
MASETPGRQARSAAAMTVGVLVVGLSGFGFLAVVGNTLSSTEAVAVTGLYMIINIVGPGLFYSLEQETSRLVSSGLASGVNPATGLRRTAILSLVLSGATTVVVLALSPILVSRNFGGHTSFIFWLVLGIFAGAAIYFVRGALAGYGEFGTYSVTLIAEGTARLVPCFVLAVIGSANQDLFGLLFAAGALLAALPAVSRLRHRARNFEPTGPAVSAETVHEAQRFGRIARSLALLATATLLTQLVSNLAPLLVSARMVDQAAVASAFNFAFVLSRVPLLLYGPVQSMMMPGLTASTVRGDHVAVRRTVRKALMALAVIGAPAIVGAGLLGPWVVVTFFGAEVRPSAMVMALLALSTMLLLVSLVFQPALVALGKQHTVSVAWIVGTAVLIAVLALPIDPIDGAVIAQLVGPIVVVVIAGAGLLRATAPTNPAPVVTQSS